MDKVPKGVLFVVLQWISMLAGSHVGCRGRGRAGNWVLD